MAKTEMLNGVKTPVIEVVKSPSGEQLMDKGAPNDATTAVLSTINQTGMAQSDDLAATREVVSPTTLPLDYQYNEKQMLANVSVAISSDIEDMTETELLQDETFGYASKKMFRAFRGEDFTGTDEEATQYGIDLMRRVENNLVELGSFSHKVQNMNQDDAKVALYMLDMFEAKEFTGRGFAEALGYMGQDPTTYIGLGTFGWGFAGKEAAKQATKQGIKATLQKIAYSGAAAGAIEGGVYTGAFEHGKQVVSEAAGEGYDSGSLGLNVAMGTGFGAAAGKYLPEIFDYAGEKVAKWSAAKNFEAEVQAAADAGDEDAIQVLADMELLDSHYGVKEYLAGKLDEYEVKRVIREAINKKKLGGELKSFASDYLKEKGAKETIYNGTDRMGRAKYIEHSLSNVIQKLKKDIRGGESFNYGIGTTRAKLTPEFKTIAAIKKNKDRLVSSSDFEKVKEEMSAKIDEISEKLKPYYEYDSDSFGYQAEVLHAIGDQDLRGYGFKEMPEHIKEDINEITTALKEMPTEYFETKILKALDIGEFTAAIVPNGTSKETINLLKNKGLKVTKYNPSNEKARTEAISNAAEKQNILFMHPATIGGAITAAAISQTEGDNDDK